MKEFHHGKFAGLPFGEDALDAFFYDVLNTQETYEGLLTTVKFLLTLSHGQAVVEGGFSVNREALAPNKKEDNLKVICFVHDTVSAEQIEIAEFVITNELLTSCSNANNRYNMYLMDKDKEAQEPEKDQKTKSLQEEFDCSKEKEKGTRRDSTEVGRVS